MYTLRTSTLIIGPAASGKTKTIDLIKKNNHMVNFAYKNAREIDIMEAKDYDNIDCIIVENSIDYYDIERYFTLFESLNKKCIFEYSYPIQTIPKYILERFSQIIILSRKF